MSAPDKIADKVFAGTRGDGVWVSEDFGASWKKPCYGKRGPGKVRCLAFDPRDANYHWFVGDGMLHAVTFADGRTIQQRDAGGNNNVVR